jgi:hypothetical protein
LDLRLTLDDLGRASVKEIGRRLHRDQHKEALLANNFSNHAMRKHDTLTDCGLFSYSFDSQTTRFRGFTLTVVGRTNRSVDNAEAQATCKASALRSGNCSSNATA